ncbi:MAG: hypothetical protein IPJ61_18250 [Tessaracoccus sp.]|uniref:hypothetical protein n=1 Tax=Tessaracoccus sp. TaxID=1971211 RepID=UPI001ECBF3E3|nr:hypothetical protein [Tessaracoccus sp.]MBK7822926.1 hypothetical protein [Tessaracoccus sp.]
MNDKTITLTLSLQDVNVILAGLLELPAKVSLEVIGRVKQQGDEQMQETQPEESHG